MFDIDAVTFAYVVFGLGLSIAFLCIVGMVLSEKDNKKLKSNDEYDKKIIKARKRCKNKQL